MVNTRCNPADKSKKKIFQKKNKLYIYIIRALKA